MIAITNSLPVKEGAADQIVERFAESRGNVQDFPGFVSMEVLKSEEATEVLVITWWEDREAFQSWVHSEEFKRAHGRGGGRVVIRSPYDDYLRRSGRTAARGGGYGLDRAGKAQARM